jgi:hypothetical protein
VTSVGVVVPKAPLERTGTGGMYPAGEGWFVVNLRDTRLGAARGHLLRAEALLDEQAREHASHSVPRADREG